MVYKAKTLVSISNYACYRNSTYVHLYPVNEALTGLFIFYFTVHCRQRCQMNRKKIFDKHERADQNKIFKARCPIFLYLKLFFIVLTYISICCAWIQLCFGPVVQRLRVPTASIGRLNKFPSDNPIVYLQL